MAQLILNIGQHLSQVSEILGLKAYDCPYDGSLYQNLRAKIYLVIPPVFIDEIFQKMACMSCVGSRPLAAAYEEFSCLLCAYIDPTSPPFVAC